MARSVRLTMVVILVLNLAFIPLDRYAYSEHADSFLAGRMALSAFLAFVYVRTAFRYPTGSAISSLVVTGGMLLYMVALDGGASSEYSTGLVLLFCGIPVLLPLSPLQVATVVGLIMSSLLSLPLVTGGVDSWRLYFVHAIFPLSGGVVAVGSAAMLERIRFSDFVQRRRLEEARDNLKELDRVKSQFTANVQHELRTPLTLMLAPLDGMIAGDFGSVSKLQFDYLKSMHGNGLRLLKLINSLLDLAKIEGGRLRIARQQVSIGGLVESSVRGARPLAERKGIALAVRCGAEELPAICADVEAMEKVLSNLLGNALKFTDTGGSIDCICEPEAEGGVHITIADTGVGIASHQLESVFDRFAQADGSGTRRHEGTGIGLALVRELVELHGGRVWAESEGLGAGTAIHVVLPPGEPDRSEDEEEVAALVAGEIESSGAADSLEAISRSVELEAGSAEELSWQGGIDASVPVDPGSKDAEQPSTPPPEGASEILVVEDNPEMRKLLSYFLGKEYRVRAVRNGREGLEAALERRPDLILTDLMMPEMTGIELCRAIKSDPSTRGIPVVLVTSAADRQRKIEGLELGAEDYVAKPFHPRELMARVRSLVRLQRLQDEVRQHNLELERSNRSLEQALTELRETEVQLVQAERMAAVGELAAGVAHEINNPVNFATNALRGLQTHVEEVRGVALGLGKLMPADRSGGETWSDAELAELRKLCDAHDMDELGETLIELLTIATEGMQRTSRLVCDLRDFAAPGHPESTSVDLAQGLRSTLMLVGHSFNQARIELAVDIEEALPRVYGNARALNQVFLNLLKNAAEAFEGGTGHVSVVARRDAEGAVVVEISDDGPGIEPEHLEQLFDPFFSTKGPGRGSGLGLSISRRILAEHDGTIDATSLPGEGTTFTLRIPVADSGRERGAGSASS